MKKLLTFALAVTALTLLASGFPANEAAYMDSNLDGVWVGHLGTEFYEKVYGRLPIVLNINDCGTTGAGIALILNPQSASFEDFRAVKMSGIKTKKGKKIQFTLDVSSIAAEPSPPAVQIKWKLKYNTKTKQLSGKYSTNQAGTFGAEKMDFYRMDTNWPIKGMWCGNNAQGDGSSAPMALNLSPGHVIRGRGLVNDVFSNLARETFTANSVQGDIDDGNYPYHIDLQVGQGVRKITGTFRDPYNITYTANSFPAGTQGNPITVTGVTAKKTGSGTMEITVNGANFVPGAMVHLNNGNIVVTNVTYVNATSLRANLEVPASVANGTNVSVFVANPDNMQATRDNAFAVSK